VVPRIVVYIWNFLCKVEFGWDFMAEAGSRVPKIPGYGYLANVGTQELMMSQIRKN